MKITVESLIGKLAKTSPKKIKTVMPTSTVSTIKDTTEGLIYTPQNYQRRKPADQTKGRTQRPLKESSHTNTHWQENKYIIRSERVEYFDYIEVFGKEKCNELLGPDSLHITVFSLNGKMIPFQFGEKDFNYNAYQMVYICFGPSKEESEILSEAGEIPFIPFARFYCLKTDTHIRDKFIHEIACAFTFSGKEITFNSRKGEGFPVKTKIFNPSNEVAYRIEKYCSEYVFSDPDSAWNKQKQNGDLLDSIKGGRKKLINITVLEELEIQEKENNAYRKQQKEIQYEKSKKDHKFMDNAIAESMTELMDKEHDQ